MKKHSLNLLFVVLSFICLIMPYVSQAQAFCNAQQCSADGTPIDLGAMKTQLGNSTQFIPGFTPSSPGLLANLYATSPCTAAVSNYYAVVSDLYGVLTESLRCTNFGPWGYGWRATIPFYATTITTTGGTITISCNVSAPVTRISGSLSSSLTVTLNATNCTPGQRQEIQTDLSLGIFNVTMAGLVGSVATKTLGSTASNLFVFDTSGWRAY